MKWECGKQKVEVWLDEICHHNCWITPKIFIYKKKEAGKHNIWLAEGEENPQGEWECEDDVLAGEHLLNNARYISGQYILLIDNGTFMGEKPCNDLFSCYLSLYIPAKLSTYGLTVIWVSSADANRSTTRKSVAMTKGPKNMTIQPFLLAYISFTVSFL